VTARRPKGASPDINVTPLVDVCLVLLIIFMVIVPQMQAGAQVNLPGIQNPDSRPPPKSGPITVSVGPSGQLYLEKSRMERDALLAKLKEIRAANPQRKVILKGDRRAPYGVVRAVFRDVQQIGFGGVSLQVGDKQRKAKES
jgi:biopolymer transport protein TolR